jgi:lipoprotein-anchoring transpeptidase ErfK/SrfK
MRRRAWVAPAAPVWLSLSLLITSGLADAPRNSEAVRGSVPDDILAMQVRLDRAGFSPGEIDGHGGENTARALRAFQRRHRLSPTGRRDQATEGALTAIDSADILTTYRIADADVAGPFIPAIPADLMDQATLPALSYSSVLELLGERFHASPRLLQRLNRQVSFEAGASIRVPNVAVPSGAVDQAAVIVTVSKEESGLIVETAAGDFLFHAPVTTGSELDPLPMGDWTVTGVFRDPVFHYNPELFWDADPAHAKARVPPGPNNPVGLVWIDLSREHYGLHGAPEPRLVGRTQSHGCVRLTNWDALRVASLVTKGTRVRFRE